MEALSNVFAGSEAAPATEPAEQGNAAPLHEFDGLDHKHNESNSQHKGNKHTDTHKRASGHGFHLPHFGRSSHSHDDDDKRSSVGKAGHAVGHAMSEALHLIKQEMATIRHDHTIFHHKKASRDGVGSAGTHHAVDPALLFGMERTYFSATNQSFYMMMIATGLMAIDNTDLVAVGCGLFLYVSAIIHFASNYFMHYRRVKTLEAGQPVSANGSLLWTGGLAVLGMSAAVIELVYIFVYPVLDRAKAVELAAPADA
jgi:hypothetical protein